MRTPTTQTRTAEGPASDNITLYNMYEKVCSALTWNKVGVIPAVDASGIRLSNFEPRFTHVSVDFTGIEHCYTVTAENVPGLESQKSIELKLKTPGQLNKVKLDKN